MGWNSWALILYLVLIALVLPAIVGNIGGSDPVGYHLVYAEEWAKAGRLVVDPFLRVPFYASNFVLVFAELLALGGSHFVNFLAWGMALLSVLGVYSASEIVLTKRTSSAIASTMAFGLALSVILSPTQLRWMDTAYIDIPIGAFALFAVIGVLVAFWERNAAWLFASAALAGFLVGMKGSFIALLPVFAILIWLCTQFLGVQRRITVLALGLLVVTASPWYLRNLVMAGDPVPPVINIARFGRDGLMTKGEWQREAADLSRPHSPIGFITLPFRAFFDPLSRDFRENGTTAIMLLLFLPASAVLIRFALGYGVDPPQVLTAVAVSLLAAYWSATSSLLRYASLFYPTLAVAVACVVAVFPLPRKGWSGVALSCVALLMSITSPGSWSFLRHDVLQRVKDLPLAYSNDDSYMSRFSGGYREMLFAVWYMRTNHVAGRVYTLGLRNQYDFAERGIQAIGDWVGVGGYFRLYRAVAGRMAPRYLASLDVHAIVVDPDAGIPAMAIPLERQLLRAGFRKVRIPQSRDLLFVDAAKGHDAES